MSDLNALRQANGKPALKSWKASKAALAIAAESPKTLNVAERPITDAEAKAIIKEEERKVKTPKVEAPKKSVASKEGKSTAQILKDFGINPKVGRALLRRHGVERTEAAITKFLKGRSK